MKTKNRGNHAWVKYVFASERPGLGPALQGMERAEAWEDYYMGRFSTLHHSSDASCPIFNETRDFVWTKGELRSDGYVYGVKEADGNYHYELRYNPAPDVIRWVEEMDRNYILQLKREGKLLEKEPIGDQEIKAAEDTPADKDGWGHRHQFHDEIFATFAAAREEVKQFGKELSEKERQAREAHERQLKGFRDHGLLQLAKDKNIDGIRYLLSLSGYDLRVNAVDDGDRTALHHLAMLGNLDLVKQLLTKNPDVLLKDGLEKTARDYALKGEYADIAGLLKRAGEAQSLAVSPKPVQKPTPQPVAGPAPRVDHALGTDGIARISFSISYQELALVQPKIGGGGFGDVYRGTWNFAPVAVKVLHQQHLSPDVQSEFQREASLMVGLRHANIVQLYGVCLEPGHYGMVMELMPKGSLFDVLHNADERLDWKIRWEIGMDVGQGLSVLHAQGILHRDLKSLNVLLDGNLRAKLTDFGLSRVKTESAASTKHQAAGTVRWMAPELFKRNAKYTEGSDIYSYAMILWELASRKTPYEDAANEAVVIQWIKDGETETIPADCPEIFGAVTKSCWAMEPASRPKAADAVTRLGAGLRQQGFFGAGAGADPGASAPAYDARTAKPDASGMRYS